MKVISVTQNKGGVGKTTTTVNLADQLAHIKKAKVLVLDCDPQGDGSYYLTGKRDVEGLSIAELMQPQKKHAIEEAIIPTLFDNVYLVPADGRLSTTERFLATERKRTVILRDLIKKMEVEFDYLIIDCPPADTIMRENAIVVADYVLVPVDSSDFSLKNLVTQIVDIEDLNSADTPINIFVNAVDTRNTADLETMAQLEKELPALYDKRLNIRTSQDAKKALKAKLPVRTFKKGSLVNNDYLAIARHVLEVLHHG